MSGSAGSTDFSHLSVPERILMVERNLGQHRRGRGPSAPDGVAKNRIGSPTGCLPRVAACGRIVGRGQKPYPRQ